MRRSKTIALLVVAVVGVGAMLGGCGGDDKEPFSEKRFCDQAKLIRSKYPDLDPTRPSQAREVLPDYETLRDLGPESRAEDLKIVVRTLDAVGQDDDDAMEEYFPLIDDASTRLDDYLLETCGIEPPTTTIAPTPASAPAG